MALFFCKEFLGLNLSANSLTYSDFSACLEVKAMSPDESVLSVVSGQVMSPSEQVFLKEKYR